MPKFFHKPPKLNDTQTSTSDRSSESLDNFDEKATLLSTGGASEEMPYYAVIPKKCAKHGHVNTKLLVDKFRLVYSSLEEICRINPELPADTVIVQVNDAPGFSLAQCSRCSSAPEYLELKANTTYDITPVDLQVALAFSI